MTFVPWLGLRRTCASGIPAFGAPGRVLAYGPDRIVLPPTGKNPQGHMMTQRETPRPPKQDIPPAGDGLHPFIVGLLQKLPAPETEWPIESRARWLETASN